jgi:hypothetical protein
MRTVKELRQFILDLPDMLTIEATDLNDIFFYADSPAPRAVFGSIGEYDYKDNLVKQKKGAA